MGNEVTQECYEAKEESLDSRFARELRQIRRANIQMVEKITRLLDDYDYRVDRDSQIELRKYTKLGTPEDIKEVFRLSKEELLKKLNK